MIDILIGFSIDHRYHLAVKFCSINTVFFFSLSRPAYRPLCFHNVDVTIEKGIIRSTLVCANKLERSGHCLQKRSFEPKQKNPSRASTASDKETNGLSGEKVKR